MVSSLHETRPLGISHGNAICYSGYREGQDPRSGVFPSYDEIKQDLLLLDENWSYIRIYDCSQHALTVLDVIDKEKLSLKVMLGADVAAEVSNPNCPWGASFDDSLLAENAASNSRQIDELIRLANRYPESVIAVSIGNEASVEWTDHMVPVERLIEYATRVKEQVSQPVTFCENYVPWLGKLDALTEVLDFISIHTYPVWEYQGIENALNYTEQNYHQVKAHNPKTPIVITEAGWTTCSNGRGIEPWNANQELQATYCAQLMEWSNKHEILTFMFEAFDEPWKGSPDPHEPEKHWGLFTVDRKPKPVMGEIFA